MDYNGCSGCQHYQWDGSCPAFPGGNIPLNIVSGEWQHTRRHRLQIDDRVWEPRTPERDKEVRAQLAEHMRNRDG